MPITSVEEKAQRRLEVKARSTLMMGILNKHQLKFNSIKDAKQLLEAIEKRFGGNAATKNTQRNLLKQQFEKFSAPSSEMLDQTFDRLQKLVSQLELLDLDTMSMDDLYNNLEVYEPKVKGVSSSNSKTQNMAFLSSTNSSTNVAVNTANGVSTASTQVNAAFSTNIDNLSDAVIFAFLASQPNSPQLAHEDLEQIHLDDVKEMDFRWKMAMLAMKGRKFLKKANCQCDQAEKEPNYALMAYTSSSSDSKGIPQMDLHDKGVIDSGCLRHMTWNMSYLIDYKEIYGGYVAFRGNPKGGKITRKCTIKTGTKNETSGILKSFIIRIENLVDHKAEAVNTACYVQNRVLVVKPHNKTSYELFHGRTPTLSFMRLFGCPVTILNTLDHLGKFDGKADEGFFVGYSLNSKAFKVFNSRTRIVEENLHIRFSENTPNVIGSGPD
nr:retrovirus-related Pol polyprotein from transposon TNT 1-94 [Tanacetum cinerariifolium]